MTSATGPSAHSPVTPHQVAARIAPRKQPVPDITPAGRRLSRKARAQAQELGIAAADVDATIEHPHATEPTHQHNGTLFVRGTIGAIVPHDAPDLVVALLQVTEISTPLPRPRRAGGGTSRNVPQSLSECERLLRSHGFEITTGGAHSKATHPDRPGVTIALPHTPSDHRSWMNLVADIRRRTGIDITRRN